MDMLKNATIIITLKTSLFLTFCMCVCSCSNPSPQEKKAQTLVKLYLDSLNKDFKYELIGYHDFHPIYDTVAIPTGQAGLPAKKTDPPVRAWVIYVDYLGKNGDRNVGKHSYQIALDKDLSKHIVEIGYK